MRTIQCECCKVSLGEIHDAKLRKDIKYLCAKCLEMNISSSRYSSDFASDFMNDIFKMNRR